MAAIFQTVALLVLTCVVPLRHRRFGGTCTLPFFLIPLSYFLVAWTVVSTLCYFRASGWPYFLPPPPSSEPHPHPNHTEASAWTQVFKPWKERQYFSPKRLYETTPPNVKLRRVNVWNLFLLFGNNWLMSNYKWSGHGIACWSHVDCWCYLLGRYVCKSLPAGRLAFQSASNS